MRQPASVCGAAAADTASKISADLYLLGWPGSTSTRGFTNDPDVAAIERFLVGRAADIYVLASSDSLGTVAAFSVVELSVTPGPAVLEPLLFREPLRLAGRLAVSDGDVTTEILRRCPGTRCRDVASGTADHAGGCRGCRRCPAAERYETGYLLDGALTVHSCCGGVAPPGRYGGAR